MSEVEISEGGNDTVSVDIVEPVPQGEAHEIGVTSATVAADQDKDPSAAYEAATSAGDIEGMVNVVNNTTSKNRLALMQKVLEVSTPESVQEDASDLVGDMAGANGILGPYVQQIKSMPSSIGMSERDVKGLAVLNLTRESLGEFQSTGLGDSLADIGGIFIPKRKAEAVIDVAVRMGFVTSTLEKGGIFLDPTPTINKMRNIGFALEDPEEKALYLQAVSEAVSASSDNNLIKQEIMDNIFGTGPASFDPVFEAVSVVEIGQLAQITAKTVKVLSKSGSPLNMLRSVDSPEAVADIISRANVDETLASRIGVSKADIGDALNPLFEGANDNFKAQVVKVLDLEAARLDAVTDGIRREGVVDRERMEELMRAAEIEQLKIPGVTNAKVISNDETGFVLQFAEELFTEGGKPRLKLKTKQVDFKVNQQGRIGTPTSEYNTFLKTDPNARMTGKLRNWFVSTVERISRQQDQTASSFDKAMGDALGDLSEASANKVDEVLLQGSKDGKVYTFTELLDSGIGANSLKLTEAEAVAYYGTRGVVNNIFSLKNKQIVDNYLATGVKLYDDVEGVLPIESFDDAASAMKGWSEIASDSRWINVMDEGLKLGEIPVQLVKFKNKGDLTREALDKAYEAGYVLAKNITESGLFKKGDFRTQWGLVKREKAISPRGQQVLNRIPGYMPRQRSNGFYFIKSSRTGFISGASKEVRFGETVSWSDSARTADEWIAAQDDPSKFTKVFDREMSAAEATSEITKTHGGLYSGARKSELLPYIGDASGEFRNSFESLQNYINHIGKQYPASLYRLGSEQRLMEIARDLGVSGVKGSNDVLERAALSGLVKSSKEFKLLKDIKDQVDFINMVPTSAELAYSKRLEQVGVLTDTALVAKIPFIRRVPKFFYAKAAENTHPSDIIRGLAFNHLLGLYNPSQILVQFSGALVSFAVSPGHFTKALPKAMGWSQLDLLMGDPIAQAKVMNQLGKSGLKAFSEEYGLWTKSGFRESVVNGNANYTSVFMKNLPYDSNIVQKAVSNHTIFYKMGELANTRMAFATAIGRFKAKNGVSRIDPNDFDALEAITKDTEILRLNMSRANQSDLNKGWLSVPLQFQQVITKYFEKVLPKGFGGTDELTRSEKLRLLAIPTAITGTAGLPFAEPILIEMLSLLGVEMSEMSPEAVQAAKFGALGYMMGPGLDLNVDLATRMTLGADVPKAIFESIAQQKAVWEWLGPAATVGERYFRNGQYVAEAFDLSVLRNEEVNLDSMKFMLSVLAEAATDIPTLSRNYKQYVSYFLTQNPQFIKDGNYLFDLETMNDRTALFAIAGFQVQEISEMYDIDKVINEGRAAVNAFGDSDKALIRRILSTHVLNESVPVESQALGSLMINSILTKYGSIESAEIMKGVFDLATDKRFRQDDLLFKYLMETEKRMEDNLGAYNTMISRKFSEFKDQE